MPFTFPDGHHENKSTAEDRFKKIIQPLINSIETST